MSRRFRLDSPAADHPGRDVVSACFGEELAAPSGDLVYGVEENGIVVSHLDLYWKAIHIAGRRVEVAAIGQVGTLPTYRSRGFASSLLQAAHEDARTRVPFAALFGSPAFYSRFGYRETNLTDELGFLLCPFADQPAGPIGDVDLGSQRW